MEHLHVLLAEDNPADAELISQALASSRLQIDVAVVDDGEKALKYLRREPPYAAAGEPDLLLLDLNLPKLSGEEVLREVKRDRRLAALPVVVLTSSDAEAEVSRCYAQGANCYIVKPVDLKAFLQTVAAIEQFWFSVVKLRAQDHEQTRKED